MFLIKFPKVFISVALLASACRFWQPETAAPAQPTPAAVEEIKSEIPFATKEPETFQTEIVVTTNGIEDIMFTARNSENHLTIYDYRKKSEFSLLQTAGNGSFLIARNQKIYAENRATDEAETADDFPISELLNEKPDAKFESLGTESGFVKYLIRLNESKNSEIVVTIDQKFNLPVKQEFYSLSDGQKILVSTTELKNFSLQADARNFDFPKDYKKVSAGEFQETLRRERTK